MQFRTPLLKMIFIITLAVFCVFAYFSDKNSEVLKASSTDVPTRIKEYQTPTKYRKSYVLGLLGIRWLWKAGYELQPDSNYSAYINETVNVNTMLAINNVSEDIKPTEYYWWTPSPAGDWHILHDGDNNGQIVKINKSNLEIRSSKPGTMYYQLGAHVYPNTFNPDRTWSKMTAVHFQNDVKESSKIFLNVDADYLYLDQNFSDSDVYAHAHTDNEFATDKNHIRFSTDDPNIATIDEKTGQIHVNQNGISGTVVISATLPKTKSHDTLVAKQFVSV